jgi:hypothetical protein
VCDDGAGGAPNPTAGQTDGVDCQNSGPKAFKALYVHGGISHGNVLSPTRESDWLVLTAQIGPDSAKYRTDRPGADGAGSPSGPRRPDRGCY